MEVVVVPDEVFNYHCESSEPLKNQHNNSFKFYYNKSTNSNSSKDSFGGSFIQKKISDSTFENNSSLEQKKNFFDKAKTADLNVNKMNKKVEQNLTKKKEKSKSCWKSLAKLLHLKTKKKKNKSKKDKRKPSEKSSDELHTFRYFSKVINEEKTKLFQSQERLLSSFSLKSNCYSENTNILAQKKKKIAKKFIKKKILIKETSSLSEKSFDKEVKNFISQTPSVEKTQSTLKNKILASTPKWEEPPSSNNVLALLDRTKQELIERKHKSNSVLNEAFNLKKKEKITTFNQTKSDEKFVSKPPLKSCVRPLPPQHKTAFYRDHKNSLLKVAGHGDKATKNVRFPPSASKYAASTEKVMFNHLQATLLPMKPSLRNKLFPKHLNTNKLSSEAPSKMEPLKPENCDEDPFEYFPEYFSKRISKNSDEVEDQFKEHATRTLEETPVPTVCDMVKMDQNPNKSENEFSNMKISKTWYEDLERCDWGKWKTVKSSDETSASQEKEVKPKPFTNLPQKNIPEYSNIFLYYKRCGSSNNNNANVSNEAQSAECGEERIPRLKPPRRLTCPEGILVYMGEEDPKKEVQVMVEDVGGKTDHEFENKNCHHEKERYSIPKRCKIQKHQKYNSSQKHESLFNRLFNKKYMYKELVDKNFEEQKHLLNKK